MLSTVCESLPEEGSITRVTGRTVQGTNNLHFFVHERGKHIQIGQCCLIVEIHVNDQMMEKLRAEGTLQGKSNTGPLLLKIHRKLNSHSNSYTTTFLMCDYRNGFFGGKLFF